jgi:hypothetical protein
MFIIAKRIALTGAVLGASIAIVSAGEIYGKVTEGGASVGDAASLSAKCGAKDYPAVKTDKSGSYRLVVAETGKCSLTVSFKGQSESITVASYDDAVQVDLVVELKDGKLAVRRT